MSSGPDVTATFCATLVDEWIRGGVTDVVVCPGSRSTPLALAVGSAAGLRLHVHHDERSAGFMALGLGLAGGRPAVVVVTSGTAVAELHAAVIEADQARVPLIVASADRPPELQGVGAPQTIDQNRLLRSVVRWFAEPGVPDDVTASSWRALAARSVWAACAPIPGPVHLNLAFREPLVGSAGDLPTGRRGGRPWTIVDRPPDAHSLRELQAAVTSHRKGLIVAGGGTGVGEDVHELAERLGWPVLADHRSGARLARPHTIGAADAILRHRPTAERLRPELILRLGEAPTSRVVNEWLDSCEVEQILVDRTGAFVDPGGRLALLVSTDPAEACRRLLEAAQAGGSAAPAGGSAAPEWLEAWTAAERAARSSVDSVLARHPEPTEPGVARDVVAALPEGAVLFTSSSMPVRDVEWYSAPRAGVRQLANRGANGIDGVTSTAVGVALGSGMPTVLLIGDVALLHDSNGLLGLSRRPVSLTIVVVDNDGGGIFSFLPQAKALPADRFEQLFGTPHGVDLAALASVHGLPVTEASAAGDVGPAVAKSLAAGGASVVVVRTRRAANVSLHDELHAAVSTALADLG